MSVTIKRYGSYAKHIAKYENVPTLKIGVPRKNAKRSDGTSNAMLLGYHQFGGPNLPARGPLNVLRTDPGFRDALVLAVKLGVGMELAGEVGVAAVKDAIRAGLPPPITLATLQSRKVNKTDRTPLIDTGEFIESIGYEVKK